MKTSTRYALEYARHLIDKRGWMQGGFSNLHGYCVTGACIQATGRITSWYSDLFDELAKHLEGDLDDNLSSWSHLVRFNDHEERTKEEVLGLIDKTLEAA